MRDEMNVQSQNINYPISWGEKVRAYESFLIKKIEFNRSEEFKNRTALFRYGSGGARIEYAELLGINENPMWSVEFD